MSTDIRAALERLLPCPFCGSEASLEDERLRWVVRCSSCSACVLGDRAPEPEQELPESYWEPFRQSAVDRWNCRPAAPPAPEPGELVIDVGTGDTSARVVLARWGPPCTPPAPEPRLLWSWETRSDGTPPAPEPGEVGKIAARLKELARAVTKERWLEFSMCIPAQPLRDADLVMDRAATLLRQQQHLLGLACQELDNFMEQQPPAPAPVVVPVPVTERLPDPRPETEGGDCDAEGRCWVHIARSATPFPNWTVLWRGHMQPYHSHWLPFHAIPLPQAGEGEV
jgi:hypothetical protein